jgi:hypothetical protein
MQRWLVRIVKGTALAALALLVVGIGIWGALLLEYAGPRNDLIRTVLVVGFAVASLATIVALFVRRWRWPAVGAYALPCAALLLLCSRIEPTTEPD